MDLEKKVAAMREYFLAGGMRPLAKRIALLKKLKAEIRCRETEIAAALKADFNKNEFDTYITEIGVVYGEINAAVRNVRKWAEPKKARMSMSNFPAKGRIYPEGYGVVLVIAPWNYPFQLALAPLVGAIAAGNCVAVKPASRTKETARVIAEIVAATFSEREAVTVLGGRNAVNVLDVRFDYMFFTGGKNTGRLVMEAAAKFLTPVSLELGGKSPCIVDKDADVGRAAKRIAWAKYVNGGQTCVAPDYLLLHEAVYDAFIAALAGAVREQFYADGVLSPSFAYVSDENKAAWAKDVIGRSDVIFGGGVNGRCVEPTALRSAFTDEIMEDEIFAPILPVIPYADNDRVIEEINARPRPLALYYFGGDPKRFIENVPFGGGCVNDAVMHVAEHTMPFGGVGESGMGMYHGKFSFDTFTHYKSVLWKGKGEMNVKYPPHTDKALRFVKKVIK